MISQDDIDAMTDEEAAAAIQAEKDRLDEEHLQVIFATSDPEHPFFPAATTMLMVVCEGDHTKFDQAMRLVRLFCDTTIKREELK